jgi:TPR repeat protein
MDRVPFVLALLLASAAALAQPDGRALYEQAVSAERSGNMSKAIELYVRAARAGNGKSAARLAEIYDKGAPGVSRDYAESLKWHNAARTLGDGPPLIGDFPDRQRGY